MKTIMVMFDSLNRHFLPNYGCDWTHAPNFRRLGERCATFDRAYVGSMPCMPARREFHTSRTNFLHTGWGPLEPYDESIIDMLNRAGVHTHLATDHYHYFEDGGLHYHNRYRTWEFFRGQEGDPFFGHVGDFTPPAHMNGKGRMQDWINRAAMPRPEQHPGPQTFRAGLSFIEHNHAQDDWLLQIEAFDPHEPFFSDPRYLDLYASDYEGPLFDWPPYAPSKDHTPEQIAEIRRRYAALLTQCDRALGDVLDAMDRHALWSDTMLVVWTDHGHMLGEHDCFAKNWQPWYQELANTPFFMWDPRHPEAAGERRSALVQPSVDLGPTLLEAQGLEATPHMLGRSLTPALANDTAIRDGALFGVHSGHVSVTDGHHVYMRAVENPKAPLTHYSAASWTLRQALNGGLTIDAGPNWSWTKGCPIHAFTQDNPGPSPRFGTLLFDVVNDPGQTSPITAPVVTRRMTDLLMAEMARADAPRPLYDRLSLAAPASALG